MESPIKSAQLRAAVVPSIFVNEQNASEAPKAHLLKRPKDQILGWLFSGGTTILYTSKPNYSSERDQDDFVAEEVLKVAPGLACDLGQAVETSPEPACETNDGTEKSVQVQLLMHHEGSQTDEKIILSSTAMQTEPYTCSSGFLSCVSLERSSSLASVRSRLHSCQQCTYVTVDKSTMSRHLPKHMGEPPFQCHFCPAAFMYKSKLGAHLCTHTGDRPFPCTLCSASFSIKMRLNEHMRIHTGERPFSCAHCNASFSMKGHLTEHIRTHTGERPFSCVHCNASFVHNSSLKRHIRTHTGERPFFCVHCNASFSWRSSLMRHIRKHTGERPFSCIHCNASFVHKDSLNRHIRKHTRERPFSCVSVAVNLL
ncbi:uncharacterized protein LOC119167543 isoform X1 [Rhipicephalus microplus]|uniref:uncharacterized protein LOC119167543 isoform X1 n=1 Tax=Rhipicephalus microplus TaxID=6941 RepID=UPI001889BB96|nr:gastrula zinc finger protein XlCGF8.2DB-like isoform X1 [Rhipicephalus microplus]